MQLSPGIAIGQNAHTPPLQDLLEDYQGAILCIRRLSHGWYAVERSAGQGGPALVWLSDQPFDFPTYMQAHLPIVLNTEQSFWRHNEAGGVIGRWMVPADSLSEICCNGLFDRELNALAASYVRDRQAAQQRAAALATAYQPAREQPGAEQQPAVY